MKLNDALGVGAGPMRFLWILFSDANSRCNTIVEECAHLQDTIASLVANSELFQRIISDRRTKDLVKGFERPVVCDPEIGGDIADLAVRDRAFLSLWNLLGGLLVGINANQQRHRAAYENASRDLAQNSPEAGRSESLFWYLSLRGYLLNQVHMHYTGQLLHAHEKLIQMLENQAGTLPQPILFRRWNSAMYGEFLSEYSRHVNWECREATRRLTGSCGKKRSANDGVQSGTKIHSLTHTWTHYPTSVVRYFDVNLKLVTNDGMDEKSERRRFAIIRSAYFYLEQPVLFPLLYHECAHINFPDAENYDEDHRTFFGSRAAAVKSLRLAKFPTALNSTYENFWTHFTEEIWADSLAIALGGRAYFVALALQIFGLSGGDDFNLYHIDEDTKDTLYPLDELGRLEHRKYEIPYPALETSFFWEARLMIAADVLALIETEQRIPTAERSTELIEAVKDLLRQWCRSGERAFKSEGTSYAHEKLWDYRGELNEWVSQTSLTYLKLAIKPLLAQTELCPKYHTVSTDARSLIAKAVNGYRQKYFSSQSKGASFSPFIPRRLESLAADVRWLLSGDVIDGIERNQQNLKAWTDGYANWMRNDGGIAFRLGLEASKLRLSLLDAIADIFSDQDGPWKSATSGTLSTELREIAERPEFLVLRRDRERIRRLLRRRQITNSPAVSASEAIASELLVKVDLLVDRVMRALGESKLTSTNEGVDQEIGVGTICFGSVRPDTFARYQGFDEPAAVSGQETLHAGQIQLRGSQSPYVRGLRAIAAQTARSAGQQASEAAANGGSACDDHLATKPKFASTFIRLIGDSNFLLHVAGSTPVERDFHPSLENTPQFLVKPRLVLHVGGERLEGYSDNQVKSLWGQVSQIKFRYRWQWFDAKQKLDQEVAKPAAKRGIEKYSLFLSSAWEDAILITWYTSEEQFSNLSSLGLGIGTSDGVCIQSSYCVPSSFYQNSEPPVEPKKQPDWRGMFLEWAEQSGSVQRLYRTSGRFDFTVVWKLPSSNGGEAIREATPESTHELQACAIGLTSMPSLLWEQITNMATTFDVSEYSAPLEKISKVQACTHFAIGGRGVRLG